MVHFGDTQKPYKSEELISEPVKVVIQTPKSLLTQKTRLEQIIQKITILERRITAAQHGIIPKL